MPIDYSIPLQTQAPQAFNPLQTLGSLYQLRGMQAEQEAQQYQLASRRRAFDESTAINEAIRRHATPDGQPDWKSVTSDLESKGFGGAAMKVREWRTGVEKEEAETQSKVLGNVKAKTEAVEARLGQVWMMLSAAKEKPSIYPQLLPGIRSILNETAPGLGDKVPEQFDAAFVESAGKVWDNTKTALEARKVAVTEAEAARMARSEGRDADKHWTTSLSKWLPTASSQEEWDGVLQTARDVLKVPLGVLAKFPTTYSPESIQKVRDIDRPINRQLQSKEVLSGGQRVQASFDPDTGQYFAPGGTTPLQDVKPAPPQVDPALQEIRALTAANLREKAKAFPDLTPVQFNMANKLADDFTRDSKNFIDRSQSIATIEAGAQDPSAAGDLSLIFSYMKMLDPGSAVRESEQANAQNAAGVPDQVRNLYNRVMTGQRLAPEQRNDFVKRAKMIYAGEQKRQESIVKTYTARAKRANLPTELVVMDYGTGQPATSKTGGMVKMRAPNGQEMDVDASLVDHYKSRGATVVR
jgi:hypothetical protein